MAVTLAKKGAKVSLAKIEPGLTRVGVGLGWKPNKYDGGFDFDLDAACFVQKDNGKVGCDQDFVFYNNLTDPSGAVTHTGDDKTGGNSEEGDDELILVELSKLPADRTKIAFTATINDAERRGQNFGMVSDAYVRLYNLDTGTELIRYDLGEEFSIETAIVVCELYKHNGEWKFNAVGSGFQGGLRALCLNYGVDVE